MKQVSANQMLLRDYFAAQCISQLAWWEEGMLGKAKSAYEVADAMMEARQ